MGSLLLEVTFEGESTFPQTTPQPTFSTEISTPKEEETTQSGVRAEELRRGGSQGVEEKTDNGSEQKYSNDEEDISSFLLYKESIEVLMHAEMMVKQDDSISDNGEDFMDDEEIASSTNTTNVFSSEENQEVYEIAGENWVKKHELDAKRQLQCTFTHTKRKNISRLKLYHGGNI